MAATQVATIDHGADATSRGVAGAVLDYFRATVARGAGSVRSAAGKTGELAGAGIYRSSYGLSYGVVFGAVFVKELLPESHSLRRGFENGAEAAFGAVEARKAAPHPAEEARAPRIRSSRKAAS